MFWSVAEPSLFSKLGLTSSILNCVGECQSLPRTICSSISHYDVMSVDSLVFKIEAPPGVMGNKGTDHFYSWEQGNISNF